MIISDFRNYHHAKAGDSVRDYLLPPESVTSPFNPDPGFTELHILTKDASWQKQKNYCRLQEGNGYLPRKPYRVVIERERTEPEIPLP